jgi:hypothetical protein
MRVCAAQAADIHPVTSLRWRQLQRRQLFHGHAISEQIQAFAANSKRLQKAHLIWETVCAVVLS